MATLTKCIFDIPTTFNCMQNFSGGQNFSFPKLLKLVNCDGKIDVSLMSHRTNARTYTYQIKVLLNSLHFLWKLTAPIFHF